MRCVICSCLILVLGSAAVSQEKASTKVQGTLVVPKDLASFAGRLLEIRLYKYDPRLADRAADLVEKVEIKDFAHTEGTETKKTFVIGAKGEIEPKRAYYVTLFVLDGNKRTHIGDADHAKKNLCRVLTDGQPNQITMVIRSVK
jgi:hypothetical protein